MMTEKKVVLWIDEEQMALDTWTNTFEDVFGEEFQVISEIPLSEMKSMVERIQGEHNLAALILDQRLKETGVASYTGMELAEAVRQFDPKIPIYILTNHINDIGDQDYLVEYVLEKDNMVDEAYLQKISARVRRHADIYIDIISDRERQFDELLRKSIDTELTEEELEEFKKLHFWRSKAVFADEESWSMELKKSLDEQQELLAELNQEIEAQKGGE